ncbi:red chlorophyll catabolite reductase [Paraferrimonas sedimenticola]|uniref:Red chlorophyll catabolite reductase (RCC reductase) n=1 Tax=Paraferrimonas sedimenticola TaxID=375674 RepID=A0AA37RV66_9GAMM|nr:red chlorophyll catabolite reductase [Paraferrimonas sedimenticola]GLP96335.1 hypothetical protein GCM10007895_16410 [Paraferrimonas sedimenticola]
MSQNNDIKTLDEFLADNPDVDVTRYWERCWNILEALKTKVESRFPNLQRCPTTLDREYYTSPNGEFEGSFKAYSGEGVEWLVNSWLGNRKASILDMNLTVFLDQQIDVPHLVIVFGTVPQLFCYCDYTPRKNLLTDVDYLDKYYGDEVNQWYLKFRGDERFHWSVSHGNYMRALNNPATQSLIGELNDENISVYEEYLHQMVDRWLEWVDAAIQVPLEERAALRDTDHKIRTYGYERDPMNKLAAQVFGEDQVESMVKMRMGSEQMQRSGG